MIPKIIHYCWFGPEPLPERHRLFIKEWKKILSDYEFIFWTEKNAPMEVKYLQTAYKNKKWANMSNFMRLYAVYNYGGVYLDTDFQVIKRLDQLLENNCFFGMQTDNFDDVNAVNNAIFGAIAKHWFIKQMLDAIVALYDGKETAYLSSPHLTTFLLKINGWSKQHLLKVKDIRIYPKEYFYPYSWTEKFDYSKITPNTFAVHHWEASWSKTKKTSKFKKLISTFISKIKFSKRY